MGLARIGVAVFMRATSSVGIVLVIFVAAMLSACGDAHDAGGHAATTATTTTKVAERPPQARGSDGTLARQALVQLGDLPTGWGAQAPVPQLRCDVDPYAGAHAVARSPRLIVGNTGVQETVAVFRTAAASGRAFGRINAPASMGCLRRDARRQMAAEAEGVASPLELARVEQLGRWGRATRFTATAPSSIGIVSGSIDAVHLRVGRGLAALVIVSAFKPLRDELYERVVAVLSRRLRAELG
jgi:hypothetical protein